MRISRLILWIVILVIVGAAGYGAVLIRHGFSAKDRPSLLETTAARAARNLAIPSQARSGKNPFPSTAQNLEEGKEHFADHCALCHSNDGGGDTEMGRNMYPKPPDMRLPDTQKLTDGELYYIINNGVRLTGMPAWGDSHSGEDSWKLVLFIRHLPQLTAEEKKDMERFNPKGADEADEGAEHHHHDEH